MVLLLVSTNDPCICISYLYDRKFSLYFSKVRYNIVKINELEHDISEGVSSLLTPVTI
jgi:hypothetical protein